jgi:hypothetical protein
MCFETRRQAQDEVIDWLAVYNRRRINSTLGYTSPMAFKENWRRQQKAQAVWEALHGGKVRQPKGTAYDKF